MLFEFAYTLRRCGIRVTTGDILVACDALTRGLHESSLSGFFHTLRSLWVKRATDLDVYDQVFSHVFRGVELDRDLLKDELLEWLKDARENMAELTDEERALAESLDPEEIERMFRERLEEQNERHDGGDRWIGTGGKSPFGHSGAKRKGIRVGGQSKHRSAIRTADARKYKGYRDDMILDTRQIQLALRKLRAFIREGAEDELDLDETIRATAANAGDIDVVLRPTRRSNLKLILMMDVGGSMDPHALTCSRLFTAAKKSNHFRDLRTYYFHNAVYGQVFETSSFADPISIPKLMRECDAEYKLIIVGDAFMAPYELLSAGASINYGSEPVERKEGIAWFQDLREHYKKSMWLNPEPPRFWDGNTIEMVRRVFPMYPLTLSGLGEGIKSLTRAR